MNNVTFNNFVHFRSSTSGMNDSLNDSLPRPDAQVYLLQQNEKTSNICMTLPRM